MHRASSLRKSLTEISAWIAGLLLAYTVIACTLQILSRHTSLPGVGIWEESARYALVAMVFLGLPAVAGRTADVTIDLINNLKMPGVVRRLIDFLVIAVSLAFLGLFAIGGYTWAQELQRSQQITPSMQIPYELLPWPMIVGTVFTALVIILVALSPADEIAQAHLDPELEGI